MTVKSLLYLLVFYQKIYVLSRGDNMTESKGNSQTRAKNKYNSKNYDSLRIVVKKGKKAIIRQYAQEQGKSINGLVNELLEEKIPQLKVLKENRTE